LKLDFKRKIAALDSRPLVLTRKEYELFSLLVENTDSALDGSGGAFRHSVAPLRPPDHRYCVRKIKRITVSTLLLCVFAELLGSAHVLISRRSYRPG
jgi:hypothetical protein